MDFKTFEGKTKEEALKKGLEQLNKEESDILYRESTKKGGLFKGTTSIVEIVTLEDVVKYLTKFLKKLLEDMGLEVNLETKIRGNQISIKMYSNNNGILIGKNGQTLKALQTILISLIHKEIGVSPYILLDVENYKDKQNARIERLAKNVAREVRNTQVEASLDNMNSYERRIVHNILTDYKGITTESVGEEPNRHVVIKPSKD